MTENNLEFSTEERLKALIDTLDAYISQYHGGSVEMVNFDGTVLEGPPGWGLRKLSTHR